MNRMTIMVFVFFVALLSYGMRVYAQEKKNSVNVEQTTSTKNVENQDSILKAQVDSLHATINTLEDRFAAMQQEKNIFSVISVKMAVSILLCLVLLLLLLQVIALVKLAKKASQKDLDRKYEELRSKYYKFKDEDTLNNVKPASQGKGERWPRSNQRDSYAGTQPIKTSSTKEEQRKEESRKENGEKEVKNIEKTLYCRNNEGDLFVVTSESREETSTFIIEYNPEDKSQNGVLSYIGTLANLKTMQPKSRDESFKILSNSCALHDASDLELKHEGKVIKTPDGAWKILNAIEIILKK